MRRHRGLVEKRREQVAFEVVDAEKRTIQRAGHALGRRAADQQRRRQPRPGRRGECIDLPHRRHRRPPAPFPPARADAASGCGRRAREPRRRARGAARSARKFPMPAPRSAGPAEPRTIATAVSSQEDSIARSSATRRFLVEAAANTREKSARPMFSRLQDGIGTPWCGVTNPHADPG